MDAIAYIHALFPVYISANGAPERVPSTYDLEEG